MKKSLSVMAISLLFIFSANAQMGVSKKMAEEALEVKELPLLIVLRDTDKDENRVEFNNNLKKVLEKVWKFSPIDRYISIDEWRELAKDKSQRDKYAILHYTERTLQANAPASCLAIGLLNKKVLTHFAYLPFDGSADMIVALSNLQYDLKNGKIKMSDRKDKYMEVAKFLDDSLSHKTLLIDKNQTTDNLSRQISSIFPYKFKITSKEEIDEAIEKKDKNILYLRNTSILERPIIKSKMNSDDHNKAVTTVSGFHYNCLYNAADNELLTYTYPSDKVSIKDFEGIIGLKDYN